MVDQAISDCSKAIEINPNLPLAYSNRGFAYSIKGNAAKALSDYNKAIEINPNLGNAYANRAIEYFYAKDFDKCWQDVHRAEQLGSQVSPDFIQKLKIASGREE